MRPQDEPATDAALCCFAQKKATAVQLPVQPSGRWGILAIDMREALAAQQHTYASLRSVQFCANQSVRGVFTSDLKFSLQVGAGAVLPSSAAAASAATPSQVLCSQA